MAALLILGGGSGIARAVAKCFAKRGWSLILAGRDLASMSVLAAEYSAATGVRAEAVVFDVLDIAGHQAFWDGLPVCPDAVLCAVGLLGNQYIAQQDSALAEQILCTNYNGPVHLLEIIATCFEQRKKGLIIGISSVAGDRGRGANYFYGSAKAGFTAYLSGLRARLRNSGIRVLTVKPGLADTPMLEGRKLPHWLIASPDKVAKDILAAVDRGSATIYTPAWWQIIMWGVRLLPECIFSRLNI